jgi:phenylacetate-CoA ligase
MIDLKNDIYRLLLACRSDSPDWLRKYQSWEWMPEDECKRLQTELLTELLAFSCKRIPYYQQVLRTAGVIDAGGAVRLDNWGRVPLLDKEILRNRWGEMSDQAISEKGTYLNTSGGSTGQPARFRQDRNYGDRKQAMKFLFDQWSGYSLGMRQAKLWGSPRDLFVGRETVKVRLGRWLRKELWLNAYCMTPDQMRAYVNSLNAFRPRQILAYVESIYQLARFIRRENLQVTPPHCIMVSTGTLFPSMRQMIEEVFQAPVFNRYGSREVGDIACECEMHEGLHVALPNQLVEILRPDGTEASPGEIGEIVVTSLTNFTMPLIRYRIGDMGAWLGQPCRCGRHWPLLREVSGRVSDSFVTRNDTRVQGAFFNRLFYFRDWVRQFQVIQEAYDRISILIVPENTTIQSEWQQGMDEITRNIRLVMGEDCQVDFSFVPEILASESGKYRYTQCRINGGNDVKS